MVSSRVLLTLSSYALRADGPFASSWPRVVVRAEKITDMLVVGERDMAARVVSPRTRDGQQLPATSLDEMARMLAAEAVPPVVGGTSQAGSSPS